MSYYVSGYYQEKAILKKEGQLFFLKCEEADAPTGTMVQGNTARLITELPEKEQQEIRQERKKKMIQDKFSMEQQDNIFYAKRNIVDSIYSQSKLEGIAVTFPDTQEIYEGRSVAGLSVEDIVKVNNLKHGWEFLFDTVDYPLDLRYVRQLNKEIGVGIVTNAGDLRNSDVSIGGTSWKPEIPIYEKIES